MATIGEALILTTNSSKLTSGLDSASKKIKGFAASSTQSMSSSFGGIASMAMKFAAPIAAAATLYKVIDSIKNLDEQQQMADNLGSTTEAFTGLTGAASKFGIETQTVYKGLIKMSQNAADSLSNAAMAKSFEDIGINAQEFAALGVDEQFDMLHKSLSAITDPAARTRAAIDLMGKSGKELAPLFGMSTSSLEDLRKQFKITQEEMANIQKTDEAMDQLAITFSALWRGIVINAAPVVSFLTEGLVEAIRALQPVFTFTFDAFKAGWSIVSDALSLVIDIVGNVVQSFVGMGQAFFGFQTITMTGTEMITGAFKLIAVSAAYVWDTIKLGAGAITFVASFFVDAFGVILNAFKNVIALAKQLPDSVKPNWIDGMIESVEVLEKSVFDTGKEMRGWGADTLDNFGDSAKAVDEWFENRNKKTAEEKVPSPKKAQDLAVENVSEEIKKIAYASTSAMLKGSQEAISLEARHKTMGMLDITNQIGTNDQKALAEARKTNKLLADLLKGQGELELDLALI